MKLHFYMRKFYMSYSRIQQTVGLLEIRPDYCLNIPWDLHRRQQPWKIEA